MTAAKRVSLVSAIRDALDEKAAVTPAATLALVYARNIDRSTHIRLALDKALDVLLQACQEHDAGQIPGMPSAVDAHAKVAAALSSVTVASELGPKLLAALDSLLLTPKAKSAIKSSLPDGRPANPLEGLRAEHDELKARRERRPAG